MNAVAMLVFDSTDEQFQLTKAAVISVLNQDIPVNLWIVDNGSTYEPTRAWLDDLAARCCNHVFVVRNPENQSPVRVTNRIFAYLFSKSDCDYILGLPNDVVLPPNAYSEMLKWPRGIVTASATEDKNHPTITNAVAVSDQTPLAVGLIRKWAWQALVSKDGFFLNERFWHYASDLDLALRISACGIRGIQLNLQFWHHGSASWRLAASGIQNKGDQDRSTFESIWGFMVSSEEYSIRCGDINFRGIPVSK